MPSPHLPDGYDIPTEVNGWTYDAETGKNAHAWYSDDREKCVGVFSTVGGGAYAKVFDERTNGYNNGEKIVERDSNSDSSFSDESLQTTADVMDETIAWMEATEPDEWTLDRVNESVFDAPAGYELAVYYLESRDTTVVYRRTDADERGRLAGIGMPDEMTPETCPYLVIHVWNGSGNATVSIAPWRGAHDEEMEEVVETPEECGLDVALTMAREYAREYTDAEDVTMSGQTGLQRWSA